MKKWLIVFLIGSLLLLLVIGFEVVKIRKIQKEDQVVKVINEVEYNRCEFNNQVYEVEEWFKVKFNNVCNLCVCEEEGVVTCLEVDCQEKGLEK